MLVFLLLGTRHRRPRSRLVLLALALIPLRALYEASLWQAQQLPTACERLPVTLEATTLGLATYYEQYGDRVWRLRLRIDELQPARCRGPTNALVYVPESKLTGTSAEGVERFPPGVRLQLTAQLRRPWGRVNPQALAGERAYLIEGIHALASAQAVARREAGERGLRARLGQQRLRLSTWIRARSDDARGPLLAALAVADRRFIGHERWEQLRRYGLTHLMVISGLHVSLAALPGWFLGYLLQRVLPAGERFARLLPVVLALAGAGAYALLAGGSLPTRRALLMLLFLSLPRLAGRPVSAAGTLSIAVLCVLLLDPLALLGASFWLSVGAVALILWYTAWARRERDRFELPRLQLFLITAMLPLSLFWFGEGSGPGALLNLLAIPLVSFCVLPALLLAVILHGLWMPAAEAALQLGSLPLAFLLACMDYGDGILQRLPAPAFNTSLPALSLMLLAAGLFVVPLGRGFRLAASLLVLPLVLRPGGLAIDFPRNERALHFPASVLAGRDHRAELLIFDVGQGTAVLLHAGGRVLLYDTGPGPPSGPPTASRSVLPTLRRLSPGGLDTLVISHPDRDHDAAERLLLERYAPLRIRRGVAAPGSVERCRSGRSERFASGVRLHFLSSAQPGDSDNNASCVLMIDAHGHRFLLPGDIDAVRERELVAFWGDRLRASVLLAAHHGSAGSSSRLWLRSVDPDYVVATAARANRFGHPAERVRRAVAERSAVLLNTATDGALSFVITADGALVCRRLRHRAAPFWRRGEHERAC
jgi:competence protein ComEC